MKRWSTTHYTEYYRLSNTNTPKNGNAYKCLGEEHDILTVEIYGNKPSYYRLSNTNTTKNGNAYKCSKKSRKFLQSFNKP
jgi:hypothetical protein